MATFTEILPLKDTQQDIEHQAPRMAKVPSSFKMATLGDRLSAIWPWQTFLPSLVSSFGLLEWLPWSWDTQPHSTHSEVAERGLGTRLPRVKSWLCLLATWPWTNHLTFLCFSFFQYKVGKITVLTLRGLKENETFLKHLYIYQINQYLWHLPITP